MPAPRLPPGWGGPKEGYVSSPAKQQPTPGSSFTSGSSSLLSATEPPVPPCVAGLEHGVVYYEHPHAPAFDPRLRSKPERVEAIKAKVPSLDFTKLRGGHRKPAAPVALAALKQVTASGGQPKPSVGLAAKMAANPPSPKPPPPPPVNMQPAMPSFAEMMAKPSFGAVLPEMVEAKAVWPAASAVAASPSKPAAAAAASATPGSAYTPWGTRKPVGTTSAAEMLRQLAEAEQFAETPASAFGHLGAAPPRPPPSSQKHQSQMPASKRPPRAKTGGIDFLARLEQLEQEPLSEPSAAAPSAVNPPSAVALPSAAASASSSHGASVESAGLGNGYAELAAAPIDFSQAAPPALAATLAHAHVATPSKQPATTLAQAHVVTPSKQPAAGADEAGYSSSDGGASIASSDATSSSEPACTGDQPSGPGLAKAHKRSPQRSSPAHVTNGGPRRLQLGGSPPPAPSVPMIVGTHQSGSPWPRGAPGPAPTNAMLNRVSPLRAGVLAGGNAFETRISKAALMGASQPQQVRAAAVPRAVMGTPPMRAGSPLLGGALSRSLNAVQAAQAGGGTRQRGLW